MEYVSAFDPVIKPYVLCLGVSLNHRVYLEACVPVSNLGCSQSKECRPGNKQPPIATKTPASCLAIYYITNVKNCLTKGPINLFLGIL